MRPGSGWSCSASSSVLLRVIVFLFGNKHPEEVDLRIGHVVTDV